MAKKEKAKTGRRETKRVRVEEKNRDSVEDETHAKLREKSACNRNDIEIMYIGREK